jgi:hypothetical protein
MRKKKQVIATLEVPGFHLWANAPAIVMHLKVRHRHLFRFIVAMDVEGSDREAEFHLLRVRMEGCLQDLYERGLHGFEFGGRSCEMLAEELIAKLATEDGIEASWCEVWEDREHGARVEVA